MTPHRTKDRRSLVSQISELQTEIVHRRQVYGRRVAQGTMRQEEMDYRIGSIEASIRTIQWLQAREALFRQRCPEAFGGAG
ncbi:MAG: hypothetical protein AAF739_16980 [Pseudomonadota bacterium]